MLKDGRREGKMAVREYYTLELQCSTPGCREKYKITKDSREHAFASATRAGWWVRTWTDTALCPVHHTAARKRITGNPSVAPSVGRSEHQRMRDEDDVVF